MRRSSSISRSFYSMTACAILGAALLPSVALAQGQPVGIGKQPDTRKTHSRGILARANVNRNIDWQAFAAKLKRAQTLGGKQSPLSLTPRGFQPLGTVPIVPAVWKSVGPLALKPGTRFGGGPSPVTGRTNAVAYDPNNANVYYCGACAGGLWKSTNKGATWTNLTDNLASIPGINGEAGVPLTGQGFSSVTVDPNNSNIVYAGTGDYDAGDSGPSGLLKSTDGGTTWVFCGRSQFGRQAIHQILVDPANSQNVIVAVGGVGLPEFAFGDLQGGLWRSTDGGKNFTHVLDVRNQVLRADNTVLREASRFANNVVYNADRSAVYTCIDGAGIYKSTDNGATWNFLAGTDPHDGPAPDPSDQPVAAFFYRLDIATSPTDPNTVYYLSDGQASVFKSTDGGATFQNSTGFILGEPANFGQGWYDFYLRSSTNPATGSDVLYVGLFSLWQSKDAGDNWQDISLTYTGEDRTHTDQHGMAVNPKNPNETLIGNDGGVYRLTYSPTAFPSRAYNFTGLNSAMNSIQFYTVATQPSNLNFIMGGSQDNSTPYSNGNLLNWSNPGVGDGSYCAINPVNVNNAYLSSQELNVFQTDNNWGSGPQYIGPDSSGDYPDIPFIAPLALDNLTPKFLYGGAKAVYLYDHGKSAWTKLSQAFSTAMHYTVSAIAVAPSDSKTVYVGTADGHIWWGVRKDLVGTDFTWTEITTSLTGFVGTISDIAVSSSNPNRIYVSSGGDIYRCTNTTPIDATTKKSLASWFPISAGLPGFHVNRVAIGQRADERILYVATEGGVYKTADSGTTWTDIGYALGLPQSIAIKDIKYVPATGTLVAATFGRGMWTLKVADSISFSLYPYLQDYRGQKSTLPVTVTISAPGSPIGETHTGFLTPAGELKITAFTSGIYDLLIQVPGFLTRRVRSVNIQPGAKLTAQMINGDTALALYDTTKTPPVYIGPGAGADNRLDTNDLLFITGRIGRRVTGPYSGDVDGDGVVTKNDYDIVQKNINRGFTQGDQ